MITLALLAMASLTNASAPPRDGTEELRARDARPVISDSSVPLAVFPPTVEAAATASTVFVGAVKVIGAESVDRSAFAPVIADYIGKDADGATLQSLARAVANIVRARGYIFASAIVPEQKVAAGTVAVVVDPGAVTEVRVTGSTNPRVRSILQKLVGTPVSSKTLERQLLLVRDVPGISVTGTKFVREQGRGVIVVSVSQSRDTGYVALDSYGSRDLDPLRLIGRFEHVGLIKGDDNLVIQGVGTPAAPGRLAYGSIRYTWQLGINGAQIGVAAAAGRARSRAASDEPEGRADSRYLAFFASAPLVRANRASVWLNGELASLNIDGNRNVIADQRDRITTASVSLYGTMRAGSGRLSGSIGGVRGLQLNSATRPQNGLSSRYDGDAVFTKFVAWADYYRPLGKQFSIRAATNLQVADRPLLAAQEAGVGGPASARAFDYYERSGDNGVSGSVELRWRRNKPVKGFESLEFFGFADGGYAWNLAGGYGDGSLSSAGGGARVSFGHTEIVTEVAIPISRSSDFGRRTARLNISVFTRF